MRSVRRSQRQNTAQRLAHPTTGGPSFGPAHRLKLVTTVAEKECNAWQRRQALKEFFPILKDDMHCLKWKPEFLAELQAQKLEHLASQEFKPDNVRDSHDRKLCEQQNDCRWTILLCVFDNDMGRIIKSSRLEAKCHGQMSTNTDDQLLSLWVIISANLAVVEQAFPTSG